VRVKVAYERCKRVNNNNNISGMGTIILLADGAIRVTNLGAASTADIGERALSKGLIKSQEQLAECSSHTGAGGAIRCVKLKPALHAFYTVFFT
jgi:hypothetical protein